MSNLNATLVLVDKTNSGDAGTAGMGTITVGLSDGLGSLLSTGQSNGLSGGVMTVGKVESAGTIQSQAYGTMSVGRASNTAIITTEHDGAFTHGVADGSGSVPSQISSYVGAEASGYALSGAIIGATGNASKAFGQASISGTVYSSGVGSQAFGQVISGDIESSGIGSLSHGNITTAGSKILASGVASHAFGEASNGYNVTASNIGALAFGCADGNSITASAQSSFAGGFPLAGPVAANGVASIAYGDALTTNARLASTFGLGNDNESYVSLMVGAYGSTAGCTNGSWVSTDALFVVGNGTSSTPSNAYHLAKDGRITTIAAQRHMGIRSVTGTVSVSNRTDRTIIFLTTSSTGIANMPIGEDGLEYFILDGSNHAMTNNITINAAGSDIFQGGGSSDTINTNNGLRHYQFLGGTWYMLAVK